MPDSPAYNHVVSPISAPPYDSEVEETVAFLPPLVSRILIAGWMLLFAGRWLIVQGMTAAGLLGPDQVDSLDNALGRCYLLLLSVTLVTLVVRIVQGLNSRQDPPGSKSDFSAQVEPAAAVEAMAEAGSCDREANRRD